MSKFPAPARPCPVPNTRYQCLIRRSSIAECPCFNSQGSPQAARVRRTEKSPFAEFDFASGALSEIGNSFRKEQRTNITLTVQKALHVEIAGQLVWASGMRR